MVVVGKHQAGVVEDHVAFALEHRHVLADGVETPADDLERGVRILLRRGEVASRALVAAVGRSALTALPPPSTAAGACARAARACTCGSSCCPGRSRFRSRGALSLPARAPAGAVLRACAIASALDARVLLFHIVPFFSGDGGACTRSGYPGWSRSRLKFARACKPARRGYIKRRDARRFGPSSCRHPEQSAVGAESKDSARRQPGYFLLSSHGTLRLRATRSAQDGKRLQHAHLAHGGGQALGLLGRGIHERQAHAAHGEVQAA